MKRLVLTIMLLAITTPSSFAQRPTSAADAATYERAAALFADATRLTKASDSQSRRAAVAKLISAVSLLREIGSRAEEAFVLGALGRLHSDLEEKVKAADYHKQAVAIWHELSRRKEESSSLASLGKIHYELGEWSVALQYSVQALEITRAIGDRRGEAKLLNNIAAIYSGMENHQKALDAYSQALAIRRELSERGEEATILNNIALIYMYLGDDPKALETCRQALSASRLAGKKEVEAASLSNLGTIYDSMGDRARSIEYYHQALPVQREIADRRGEATTLGNLGGVFKDMSQPRLAIFYLKQSVNLYQQLRQAINEAAPETQQAYLKTIDSAYKDLADVLVSVGRLPEAQAVLAMLKEEEIFEYLRRDVTEIDKLRARVDLREDEKTALARYEELFGRIGSIGSEFGKLQAAKEKLPAGTSLSPADQTRYDTLAKELEDANTAFQVFFRQLSEEFSKRPAVAAEIQENRGLQADLKSWGEGVVSLYTIAGDDRYRVLLTTPEIQTDGKFEIKAADLNKKIAEFRLAIQNPRVDPRPLGKELYDIIVKPIEKHLEGAKAKTLLWSLDGALRYVPIAALWDGKQYLGQKYENVLITLASRTRLSEDPKGDWRMLGLGVTKAQDVLEPSGTEVIKFSALPAVDSELTRIIRDEQSPREKGILTGKRLIDVEFTEQAMKDRLGRGYRAVHIASHFAFRPGDMTRSFLLLGDGTPLTMDKIRNSPQLRFSGVELLTLSACDTAVGMADANGKEFESFAVIAQQNGAKAVMATLWPVADESTSMFMTEFYRLKKQNASMTKSDAIRRAQAAMIDGRIKSSGTSNGCRAEKFSSQKTEFKCDPNAPYSHPYFWSPFVLIGNWR